MDTAELEPQIRAVLESRADTGIAWLNDNEAGWPAKIDVGTLDMGCGEHCVLGQLSDADSDEDYEDYVLENDPPVVAGGFFVDPSDVVRGLPYDEIQPGDDIYNVIRQVGWVTLTEIWKTKITALKEAA